jgi:hypothetical protein
MHRLLALFFVVCVAFVVAVPAESAIPLYSSEVAAASEEIVALGSAVDAAGYLYVAGYATRNGQRDAVVARVSPNGGAVEKWFFGGTGLDEARGIAVDRSGDVYVAGLTRSTDFPLVNPARSEPAGLPDAFAVKLRWGVGMVYSTYVGRMFEEWANAVAVDRTPGS